MKFISILAALLACAACSKEESAVKPPPPPAPLAKRPEPEPAPAPLTPPAPKSPPAPAPQVPANTDPPAPGLHLPVITIRTMDRKEMKVQLNGEDLGVTPCLWSITSSIAYAGLAMPADSMPDGARFITSTQHGDDPRSKVDVYVISQPENLAKYPKLRKGECVVAVQGLVGGTPVRGPLRLYVEGYHFTDYTPLVNPDGDEASRFLRTLWFERNSDE